MDVSVGEVLRATGGEAVGVLNESWSVNRVSSDTRTLEKNDLFFALKGERFDGHTFVAEALKKGAKHFVVSDRSFVPAKAEANFILVADTLRAYGDLAKVYRQKFRIPIIAITGSAGKTTVKELTAHLLSSTMRVLKNRGTENNLVGVPKTLFQLDGSTEVAVLELGTNQPGEIDRLASIAAPQVGILTHIGASHLEGLKSLSGVKEEKLRLMHRLERGGVLILNTSDPELKDVQSGVHKMVRVSFSKEGADLTADRAWCHEKGCSFYVGDVLYETPLIGLHNILNTLLAIAAARAMDVEPLSIQKSLATFRPMPGRLTLRESAGITFLDDTYNSNPGSFRAGLEALSSYKTRGKKGVVCGDMLELGSSSEAFHRQLGATMAGLGLNFIIAAGPQSKNLADEALKKGFSAERMHWAADASEAGKICREIASAGDVVLVKGSRGMQMEKVFECFITSSIR